VNARHDDAWTLSRRDALLGTGLAAAAATAAAFVGSRGASAATHDFHGVHQGGIATPVQQHLAFATFDVTTASRGDLVALMSTWTTAAATLTAGRAINGSRSPNYPPADTGEVAGMAPSSLTLTFGVGPSLFDDRFALRPRRPAALADLPAFPGDRLDPIRSGGDLCVQACADDSLVAFHAVRNLARVGEDVVALRNIQFAAGRASSGSVASETPRNLLGFKDGTSNVRADSPGDMDEHVWVGSESDQSWMVGGTYLVARRIRTHLEQWSSLSLETQQDTIGRFRESGAPLTGRRERDAMDLSQLNSLGLPVIPSSAHVRVASASANNGAKILRRGFNFADGIDPRTGEIDAGLMFICFQKDPRRQFVTLQDNLSTNDALSRYVTHTASGLFACPPGVSKGEAIGAQLFD